MSDDNKIETEGVVTEILPGTEFKVRLNNMDKIIKCNLSGKIKMNKIRILVGDKVSVKISPYNLDLGTIYYRHK